MYRIIFRSFRPDLKLRISDEIKLDLPLCLIKTVFRTLPSALLCFFFFPFFSRTNFGSSFIIDAFIFYHSYSFVYTVLKIHLYESNHFFGQFEDGWKETDDESSSGRGFGDGGADSGGRVHHTQGNGEITPEDAVSGLVGVKRRMFVALFLASSFTSLFCRCETRKFTHKKRDGEDLNVDHLSGTWSSSVGFDSVFKFVCPK